MKKNFQVNLGGIINILSNHLYSSNQVFIRELLQNAHDAIAAVTKSEIGQPFISVELVKDVEQSTLIVSDNGSGLTLDEINEFLSSVGSSIKRGHEIHRKDFIGRFGVGLLSCFMVCDEIILVTKSRKDSKTHKWVGYSNGSYTVTRLDDISVTEGTKVFIKLKKDVIDYYTSERIKKLITNYASYLPFPISFNNGVNEKRINEQYFPWETRRNGGLIDSKRIIDAGVKHFGEKCETFIDLSIPEIGLSGVAYILPANTGRNHSMQKVYLKRMWLADTGESLLPDWAFFLNCFVNSENLTPTTSRESFYINDEFKKTKQLIRNKIKDYFRKLSIEEPEKMASIIHAHYTAFKTLAVEEDDVFELIISWLKFTTSSGNKSLSEIAHEKGEIQYTDDYDKYRQIKPLAQAQQICIVNAAFLNDTELIKKYHARFPDVKIRYIDTNDFVSLFAPLELEEKNALFDFTEKANLVLKDYNCQLDIRRFEPKNLPGLYFMSNQTKYLRAFRNSISNSNDLFGGILSHLMNEREDDAPSRLCINLNNKLILRLVTQKSYATIEKFIATIYVNALLQGHHPLSQKEMNHLTESLTGIMEMGISNLS